MKTKTQEILEYIEANQPCKAKVICEGVGLEKRHFEGNSFYYVGWSGYRAYLTAWGRFADKTKIAIKRTVDGYILTEYGQEKLNLYRQSLDSNL